MNTLKAAIGRGDGDMFKGSYEMPDVMSDATRLDSLMDRQAYLHTTLCQFKNQLSQITTKLVGGQTTGSEGLSNSPPLAVNAPSIHRFEQINDDIMAEVSSIWDEINLLKTLL